MRFLQEACIVPQRIGNPVRPVGTEVRMEPPRIGRGGEVNPGFCRGEAMLKAPLPPLKIRGIKVSYPIVQGGMGVVRPPSRAVYAHFESPVL